MSSITVCALGSFTLAAFFCCSLALAFSFAALQKKRTKIMLIYKYSITHIHFSFMHWSRTFFSEISFNQGYSKSTSNNVGINKIITENDWTTTLHAKCSTQVKNCTNTQTFFFLSLWQLFFCNYTCNPSAVSKTRVQFNM